MTTVTGAPRLPQTGSSLVTGIGESLSDHAGPPELPVDVSAEMPPAFRRWLSQPHITAPPARKHRRNPMIATPVLIPPSDGGGRTSAASFLVSFAMTISWLLQNTL